MDATPYRIVTTAGTTELADRPALAAWIAARGLAVTGEVRQRGSIALRPQLLGQPRIAGLAGPMWDGDAIRYECAETYALNAD